MTDEWKYFVWQVVDIYSTVAQSSKKFVLFDREYCFEFNLIPSKNSFNDLFVINLKQTRDDGYYLRRNLAVTSVVRCGNDAVRFIQDVSLSYVGNMGVETIWKVNKRKFAEEYETVVMETESTTFNNMTFICVFGPVGTYLKDTTRIKDIPTCETTQCTSYAVHHIQSNPNADSHESLFSDLTKLLESESFSDVALKCDGQSFSVHKIILSARSSVFSAMFQHDMSENREGIVYITDIDATTFGQFLRYIYSGQLPVLAEDSAPLFYKVGDKYAVEALKKGCAAYMVDNLKKENACGLFVLADSHGDVEFRASVMSFIKKEDNGVLKHESWRKFRTDHPNLALEVYDACNE